MVHKKASGENLRLLFIDLDVVQTPMPWLVLPS